MKREIGDSAHEAIYLAVGRALSHWEFADHSIGTLFSVMSESGSMAALRTFGVIASYKTKVQAVDQVAEIFFRAHGMPKQEIEDVRTVLSHYDRASGFRNNIAHGMSTEYQSKGVFLAPQDHNARRTKLFADAGESEFSDWPSMGLLADYRYVSADIDELGEKFRQLRIVVYRLAADLGARFPRAYR